MNEQEIKQVRTEFARSGGNASWKSRFNGKTKEEVSEMMRKLRNSKKGQEAHKRFKEAMFEEQKKY